MNLKLSKMKGFLLLLFMSTLPHSVFALDKEHKRVSNFKLQQQKVSGVITDEANLPLPGVSVLVKGTNKGTVTDFDGKYSIIANKGDVLIFSFIGFKTKEVTVSDNTINLQMLVSDEQLDEVVLIGYGSTKRKNVTTAISNVQNIETINSRPVSSLKDFLQGNISGVTVLQDGGDPSREGNIIVRGLSSVNINNPLTIVDGMPYYGPAINPNDIEAVSVLKDASSQAIYGAQAANGVIVIKTKKGKLGKPIVNLNINGGVQVASNLPTPLNAEQQSEVYKIAYKNAGKVVPSAHIASKNPWGKVTRTNWVNEIFRPATYINYATTISGASKNANYMGSLGYNTKEGILLGTKSNRYSVRLKSDFKLFDKLTIGNNVYYSRTEAIGANTSSGYSGAIINAIYMPSAAPVRDANGDFHGVAPFSLKSFAGAYGDVYNPVALLLRPTIKEPVNNVNATIFGKYEVLNGLTFKSSFAYSYIEKNYKRFQPKALELGRTNKENSLTQEKSDESIWTWENHLNYNNSFGNHNMDVSAIYSAQKKDYESIKIKGYGFSSEETNLQYMQNASKVDKPTTRAKEEALVSAIGRVMYNYDNRYFVSGSLRRDTSSRLHLGKQAEYFPAASVGWNISSENFFKVNFINFLKLRASWGEIGNLESVSSYRAPLMKSTTVNIGDDALINDSSKYLGNRVNYDLAWERIESKNIGLDAEFFASKLGVTFDYFRKRTKGIVLRPQENLHGGTKEDFANVGKILNKGLEFGINYKNNFGNVGFKAYANASHITNVVLSLKGFSLKAQSIDHRNYKVRGQLKPIKTSLGSSLYSYNLVPFLGIFKDENDVKAHAKNGKLIQPKAVPGDMKFEDVNGDGKISDEDKVLMGSYMPNLTYSFGFNLDYKGFDLGAFFSGVSGVKIYNAYKYTTHNAALQGYNLDSRVLNAWTKNNTTSNIPKLSVKDNNKNFSTDSSWYLEDGDYLKLKNITLGYTFSSEEFNFMKNSTLRAYFSAENIFTITNYSGMDPEISLKRRGIDMGEYPVSKTLSMGLSLKL